MKKTSIYRDLSRHAGSGSAKPHFKINLAGTVTELRKARNLSGADLCRLGHLDPKTLNAVEKGRIKNPSLQTLQSISEGLGVSVSDLFLKAEISEDLNYRQGTQKGAFQMEFPAWGVRVVAFTPMVRSFFFGKILFGAKRIIHDSELKHPHPIFISVLVGRFEVKVGEKKVMLKEGENLYFRGVFPHSIQNMLARESVLFILTAPSFFVSHAEG